MILQSEKEMKISVCVLTYNQEGYIKQCIESILAQISTFDFEIVISDDCSTDNTLTILYEYSRRYPYLVKVLSGSTNIGIAKNYQRAMYACSGEYIAMCEGDDYWCDNYKLQKQVEFLEKNGDYGFVGSYNSIESNNKIKFDKYFSLPNPVIDGDWELYTNVMSNAKYGPVTRTMTLCFRKELIIPYMHIVGVGNDLVLQTILASSTKFAKLRRVTGVYRKGGVSTSPNNYKKELYYNDWYVNSRFLQKRLFPYECDWNEDELNDRGIYIQLKYAIRERNLVEIKRLRKLIKSDRYQKKVFYKFSSNFIMVFVLYIYSVFK